MNCPLCKNIRYSKACFSKGRQRYLCSPCKYYYTVTQKSNVKSPEVRCLAFDMYLEGMGFHAIGRVLGISYVTIFYWIKNVAVIWDFLFVMKR